ncbi:PAS domain-containing protein [Cohnella sp. GCM10012308]|uniref:PAS domain-containing protein n=1 Tax=Cohnella sp. GCM10012308 TaxID=3317329 RepID=UPI003609DBCB
MLKNDLFSSRGIFQHYFDRHPDGLLIIDLDGFIQHANAAVFSILGYSQETLLQAPLERIFDPANIDRTGDRVNAAAKLECSARHQDGHPVDVKLTLVPLQNDGQAIGELITLESVNPASSLPGEKEGTEEILSYILEKSQNVISVFSTDGVFTYISPTVTALLGYRPEEVVGKHSAAFNHPDDILKLLEFRGLSSIDRDNVRFVGRVRHKNGDYRMYETTSEYIRDESGEVIQTISFGRDITDNKQAE